jgi:hypothetical protein
MLVLESEIARLMSSCFLKAVSRGLATALQDASAVRTAHTRLGIVVSRPVLSSGSHNFRSLFMLLHLLQLPDQIL